MTAARLPEVGELRQIADLVRSPLGSRRAADVILRANEGVRTLATSLVAAWARWPRRSTVARGIVMKLDVMPARAGTAVPNPPLLPSA